MLFLELSEKEVVYLAPAYGGRRSTLVQPPGRLLTFQSYYTSHATLHVAAGRSVSGSGFGICPSISQSGSGIESYLPKEILCLFLCGVPPLRISCYKPTQNSHAWITFALLAGVR